MAAPYPGNPAGNVDAGRSTWFRTACDRPTDGAQRMDQRSHDLMPPWIRNEKTPA